MRGARRSPGPVSYTHRRRSFVENAKAQAVPPIDVYDAAAWMAVTCLSEEAVALGGAPVCFPDFTGGKWIGGTAGGTGRYAL